MIREARLVAGVAGLSLAAALEKARRVTLHAALYSNFARNSLVTDALATALGRPDFEVCDIISLATERDCPWQREFFDVLRQGRPQAEMAGEFRLSDQFVRDLAGCYPGKVRLFRTVAIPLAPILLVDDWIFAGHYLHGPLPSPEGFWLAVEADVFGLTGLAAAGETPKAADPETRAAFRLVAECVHARTQAVAR